MHLLDFQFGILLLATAFQMAWAWGTCRGVWSHSHSHTAEKVLVELQVSLGFGLGYYVFMIISTFLDIFERCQFL